MLASSSKIENYSVAKIIFLPFYVFAISFPANAANPFSIREMTTSRPSRPIIPGIPVPTGDAVTSKRSALRMLDTDTLSALAISAKMGVIATLILHT